MALEHILLLAEGTDGQLRNFSIITYLNENDGRVRWVTNDDSRFKLVNYDYHCEVREMLRCTGISFGKYVVVLIEGQTNLYADSKPLETLDGVRQRLEERTNLLLFNKNDK